MEFSVELEIWAQPFWDRVNLVRYGIWRQNVTMEILSENYRPLGIAATADTPTLTRERYQFRVTTRLAHRPRAAVYKYAAIKILIQRLKHFVSQRTVLRLEQIFPAPLELVPIVIHQPVQNARLRTAPRSLQLLPFGSPAIQFHIRMNR